MKQAKTMKRAIIIFIIVITCSLGTLVNLSATDYGIGIIVGQPTGLSFKINNFPVIGVAWGFDRFIQTHVDFWFFSRMIQEPVWWYLGIGGKVRFNVGSDVTTPIQFGVRVPVGLQLIFEQVYEVFLEIAPGVNLWDQTSISLDGGLGFRYHFPNK